MFSRVQILLIAMGCANDGGVVGVEKSQKTAPQDTIASTASQATFSLWRLPLPLFGGAIWTKSSPGRSSLYEETSA